GAAVLGAIRAIAQLKPSIAVTAVVPTVENMPGPKALRPGDIVKTLNGKTVEVLNTDAEGRLILNDAITYAQRSLAKSKPPPKPSASACGACRSMTTIRNSSRAYLPTSPTSAAVGAVPSPP